MPTPSFNIAQDATATFAAGAWLADKTDRDEDGVIIDRLEADLDVYMGARWGNGMDEVAIQVNEVFQGARFIDQLGVGGLPSGASSAANDLVVTGSTSPGMSIIETGVSGLCSLYFGDSGGNAQGRWAYDNSFDGMTGYAANALALYFTSSAFVLPTASPNLAVGHDAAASAGAPEVRIRKGATSTGNIKYQSNEGGTYQIRVVTGADGSENYVIEMYNSGGTLIATHQFTAASADFSLGGGRFVQNSSSTTVTPAVFWLYATNAISVIGAEDGSTATLQAATRSGAGDGSLLQILGGAVASEGHGGGVSRVARNGSGTNKNGGSISDTCGTRTGSGTHGTWSTTVGGSTHERQGHNGTALTWGIFGATPVVRPAAYTPTNVTTDRSYDADTVAVAELADVVGTLIGDLQAYGVLQ